MHLGLHTPARRAFTAFAFTAGLMYVAGLPKEGFTEHGDIKPFTAFEPRDEAEVRSKHFLIIPVSAALVAGLLL